MVASSRLGRIFRSLPETAILMVLVSALLGIPEVHAQGTGPMERGAIGGRVVDAETLNPLEGARVLLHGDGAADGQDAARRVRSALTDSSGAYRFADLPAARYRIVVERIGYLPRTLEVELQPDQNAPVSVGMQIQPIRLPEVEVVGGAPEPYRMTRSPDAEVVGARARVARRRQEVSLAADAREMTHGEVVEAVTLGEPDIFRALQRVPGVATRDDYTATIWTRGATWDQTRVYFDGLELYNPTHAGWLFSAVNPDAIGSVLFHPGYRSSRWGEGTAAILDLRSRAGTTGRSLSGTAELSPASVRLALDGELAAGQLRWMAAARRTYVDLLTQLFGELTGDRDLYIPYDFSDLVFRVDGETEAGWDFVVSSILEWDHLRGDIPGIVRGNRGRWGNRAGQVTLRTPVRDLGFGPVRASFGAGQTLFGTHLTMDSLRTEFGGSLQLPDLDNHVQHQVLSARIQPVGRDSLAWAVGYELVQDGIRYAGPQSLLDVLVAVDTTQVVPRNYADVLAYSAFWGERRWSLGRWLDVETGARVEVGDSVVNGGRVRVSPRVVARTPLGTAGTLSAAWSRTFQYSQDVSPAAGPVGPQLHLSAIWLLATTTRFRPAARADVATVGVERWIGPAWLASLNGYRRQTTGLLIPNPDTGFVAAGREPDAVASNLATGVELSLRKLMGRWTGSIAYTYGTSRMASTVERGTGDTVRFESPAPADIPHALDVTAMARLGGGFRLGGAFTFGSGVPFTRLVLPDTTLPPEERNPPRLERPYGERTPSYASLDLMLEYSRAVGAWQVSAYGQLRNVLGRENAVTYLGSRACGPGSQRIAFAAPAVDCRGSEPGVPVKDNFEAGLPTLPLFGVRVAF